MLRKLACSSVAVALLAAGTLSSATTAEAYYRGGRTAGVVAGTILGLGLLGAFAATRDRDYCYAGPRRCEVVGQRCFHDRFGEYRCRDDVRCWRPRYCD